MSPENDSGLVRICDVLAVFLATFAVTVRPMFSALAAPLHRNILIYLLVFMSVLLVTLRFVLRKRLEFPARAFMYFLGAFIAITALTAFLAEYRYGAVVRTLDIIAWCTLAVVLLQVISTSFRARIVLAALLATLAVLAVNGFHQYLAGLAEIERQLPEHLRRMAVLHPSLPQDTFVKRATTGDVFGTFVIANSFAGYLIILLPAAFAAAIATWREAKRRVTTAVVLTGLTALAGIVVLFLTKSKGGLLALVAALTLGGIALSFKRLGRGKSATAALLLLVALLLTAQGPQDDDNAAAPGRRTFWLGDSAEVRVEYWKGSWEIVKRHPWLGVGPGNFAQHYLAHRTPEGSETRYAHNDYLEITVEQGLVGFVIYAGLWAAWFYGMRRKPPIPGPPDEDGKKGRRVFAVVVGLAGVAAMLFTMSRFIPTAETEMMTLVGVVVWAVVYGVQACHALRLEGPGDLRLLKGAFMLGVCAFLVHSAIDFDLNVPGVTRPLAAVLVLGLALREARGKTKPRTFGTGGQLAFSAVVTAPLALLLVFLLYPLIDMSIALGNAREARRSSLKSQACGHLNEAIESFPGNPEPYLQLAHVEAAAVRNDPRADRSRLDELLDAVKRLRPRDPAPYVMSAGVLNSQMRAAESRGLTELVKPLATRALREVEQAVRRYPTRPQIRLMHARLLEKLSRPREAVSEYRKALDFARRTSEKELKFSPEVIRGIERTVQRLE